MLERSKPYAEYVSKAQQSMRGPSNRSRAVGSHRVTVEFVRLTSRRRTMLRCRTMLEIDRKCEIMGLERVASHHLLSTEIVMVRSHPIACRSDVEAM